MAQLVLKNILAGSGNVLAGGDNTGNVTKVTIGSNLTLSGGVLSATGGGTGSVTSVALSRSGNALTITGSPITTAGTINIGFSGNSGQYIDGSGNLTTFPSIITQAQNLVTEVYNETGATLTKGTVVYINGGHGNLPTVAKAIATSDATSAQTYGVVRADITNMNNGYVTVFGNLDNLDTQAYADGTQLYLSGTTAGAWTSTKPSAPIHLVYVGIVVRSHPTQGVVEIRIQNGYELDELHDVQITSLADGDILKYDLATDLWKNVAGTTTNIAEGTNLYYTNARARGAMSANVGSALTYDSATGRYTLLAADSGTSGYLTAADWTDFDSKQASLGTGTTSQYLRGDLVWATPPAPALEDLTDVGITSPTNGQLLRYQLGTWINFTPTYVSAGFFSATSPLAYNSTTGVFSMPQATTSVSGYLSSTDWTTFNNKQAAGNYITALTGEATASGPGSVAITLTNSAVIGKVLTGLNVTGGSVSATDSILTAFGKVQNQINGLIGGSIYKGTWNASTNTPALASSVGTAGWYYIVSVAGTTNLNGITDWQLGDWAIFNGGVWQKVDNTDSVVSVNGFTGAVNLTTDNISEGATNLYYTNARARGSVSVDVGSALTYNSTTGRFSLPAADGGVAGYVTTTDYNYWDSKQDSLGTGTTSQWLRGDLTWSTVPAPALDDLTDVTITTPSNGQLLRYLAGTWINFTPTYISLTALSATAPLSYNNTTGVFSITQSSSTVNGYLSSTDWTTFNSKEPAITAGTTAQYWRGDKSWQTLNTTAVTEGTNLYFTTARVLATALTGYTVGTNTALAATDTILGAFGKVQAQINSKGSGTVTSVAALTLGTTGTDLSSTVANGTTTPVITLNVPTASATNRGALSSTDWSTFNGKQNAITLTTTGTSGAATFVGATLNIPQYQAAGTYVTSVTATSPLSSSGGTTPDISISQATTSTNGYLSSTDWNTFNNKQNALTNPVTGSGASGYIAKWNTASTITNSLIYEASSKVGINTTNMVSLFDVTKNALGVTVVDTSGITLKNETEAITGNQQISPALHFKSNGWNNLALASQSADWIEYSLPIQGNAVTSNLIWASSINGASYTTRFTLSSAGNGTFTGTLAASNLSGTNTGDVTIGTANGLSLSGQEISLALASTSTTGALSSTDWNTFNNKQSALTNPVTGTGTTNTLPKFTGTSTIGNSNITDSGSLITLGSNSYLNGNLGIGTTPTVQHTIRISKNITGSTVAIGIYNFSTIQSDVTNSAAYYRSDSATQAASFTLTTLRHYFANQSTFGAGSVVTTQSGFDVSSTLVGATNNYGFRGAIPAGTNRWNIYMDGTADNYLAGNVGIGTASPSRKLDISTGSDTDAGLIGITIGGTVANSRQAIIEKQTSGTRTLSIYSSLSSTSLEPISFYTGIGYERLTILEGGNVGIGSTAPSGKLEVNTASGTAYFTRTAGDNGTTAPAIGIATASTAPRIYSYGDLQFWNAAVGGTATNKMTLFANGNLAVGTTTDAGYKLDVNGTGRFSSSVTAGSNVVIPSGYELVYGTGTVSILGNSTSNFLDFRTSNSTKLYINSSGNVGIGTPSPTAKLSIVADWVAGGATVRCYPVTAIASGGVAGYGMFDSDGTTRKGYINVSSNYMEVWCQQNTPMTFGTNDIERMRITSGGNVLIGTTTDSGYKLDVNGTGRFSSNFTVFSSATGATTGDLLVDTSAKYVYIGRLSGTSGDNTTFQVRDRTGTSRATIPGGGSVDTTFSTNSSNFIVTNYGGTALMTIANAGAATFSSSVTATSFFESSDKRLKKEISDNPIIDNISTIKPKLYIKDGKEELGYYAQDLESVLPSAVSEGKDGFLTLSYSQVHTAKIAQLESELAELKEIIKNLIK